MATSEPPPYLMTPIDNVMPRCFVPKTLYFPQSPGSDLRDAVTAFRHGLSKTLEAIPPLSGTMQVVGPRGELGVTGPWNTVDDILHVKDLRQDLELEYQSLKDQHFPPNALDRNLFFHVADFAKEVKKVMVVHLNLIRGGMVMVLCLHHSFTDGNGTVAIAKVWAGYCRGEDGSRLVTPGMLDRERLMQGWGSAILADVPDFFQVRAKAPAGGNLSYVDTNLLGSLFVRVSKWMRGAKTAEGNAHVQTRAATLFFPKDKLAELKRMASTREQGEDANTWVSTNDALCALLGCCVHSTIDEDIRGIDGRTFAMQIAVGGRRMLDPPLPPDYIGNILSFLGFKHPSRSINSTPAKVAEIAQLFRTQIQQRDEKYIRKLIAALSSVEDLTSVKPTTPLPTEDRLTISSWASQNFYDLRWGDAIGSGIERIRIAAQTKNFFIILPEVGPSGGQESGLEVVIALEARQMERLKGNEFFTTYAQWRCE